MEFMRENERKKSQRLKSLKSLRLFRKEKELNDESIEEENKINNINKEVENKKLNSNVSSPNIFKRINISKTKTMIYSPLIKNNYVKDNDDEENKKVNIYEIERGLVKHPLCLFSKNKYSFGSKKLIIPKYLKKENSQSQNEDISTKLPEKNNIGEAYASSTMKKIYHRNKNIQNSSEEKLPIILRKRNNQEINNNKINIYKKYNNGTGMDKHVILNKSCPILSSEIQNNANAMNLISRKKFKKIYIKNNEGISLFNSTIRNEGIRNKERITKIIKRKPSNNFRKLMSKYQFVMNTNLIKLDDPNHFPEEIANFNRSTLNILRKENDKLFSQFRSIVPMNKFSEKYRDPLNNSFDKELEKERKIKEKNNVKEDILPGIKLLKEIDIEIDKMKKKKKVLKGKTLMHKIKTIIIRKAQYIKLLNVSFEEILTKYKRSPTSFSCFKTEELILAIRNKNYDTCCEILDNYKPIVLDFDYFHLTPLHWAVKSNYFQIIPKLISYGASVNEQNFLGETPLHISASKNYYESTVLLLIYLASPFINDNYNRMPFDRTNDLQLIYMFKKIVELHLKYTVMRQKFFYHNVQKNFVDFIFMEFSNQLNSDVLSLISHLR